MELGIREYRKYRIKVIVQGLRRKLEGSALEAVDLQDPVRRMMLDSSEIGDGGRGPQDCRRGVGREN